MITHREKVTRFLTESFRKPLLRAHPRPSAISILKRQSQSAGFRMRLGLTNFLPPEKQIKAEKAGNYIRNYVVRPVQPHDMQLQKASPTDEANMTTTPEIDEDALYEQASWPP